MIIMINNLQLQRPVETKRRISNSLTGLKKSQETKDKIRQKMLKRWAEKRAEEDNNLNKQQHNHG